MEIKSARCINCGANLKLEPGVTEIKCQYCGSYLKQRSSDGGDRQPAPLETTATPAAVKRETAGARPVKRLLGNDAARNAQAEAFLTRGFLFLEDGKFQRAHEYFDKCLDLTPTDDRAYIGLLLVKLQLKSESRLAETEVDLKTCGEFNKALRFAPPERKAQYNQYYHQFLDRLEIRDRERWEEMQQQARDREQRSLKPAVYRVKERAAVKRQAVGQWLADPKTAAQTTRKTAGKAEAPAPPEDLGELIFQKLVKACYIAIIGFVVIFMLPALYKGVTHSANETKIDEFAVTQTRYEYARTMMTKKQFAEAERAFLELGGYLDSEEYAAQCNQTLIGILLESDEEEDFAEAVERVAHISTSDQAYLNMSLLVMDAVKDADRYYDLVLPLADELARLNEVYQEIRLEMYYRAFLAADHLVAKQQYAETLPSYYLDMKEQQAVLADYEKFIAIWQEAGSDVTFQLLNDVHFQGGEAYGIIGSEAYLIREDDSIVYRESTPDQIIYTFAKNQLTGYAEESDTYTYYERVK